MWKQSLSPDLRDELPAVAACWAVVVAAALLVGAAHAEDKLVPGEIGAFPTWRAIGLEIPYAGDDNHNATASLVHRMVGETDWRDGVAFTRDTERRVWWASIFPLSPGQRIEFRAVFQDPDETRASSVSAITATRRVAVQPTGGRHVWVSPEGNDAGAGTRQAPFRTIARGAQGRRPGDVVHILAGRYKEATVLGPSVRGTAAQPIWIVGEKGDAGVGPVIDPSEEIPKGKDAFVGKAPDIGADEFGRPSRPVHLDR